MKTWPRVAAVITLSLGVFSDASALESPQPIGFFCGVATTSIVANQFYIPDGQCTYLSPSITGSRYGDIYRGTVGSSTLVNGHLLGFNATSSPQSGDVIPNGAQGEDILVAVFPAQFVSEFRAYFQTGAGIPLSNNYGFLPFKWGVPPESEPEEPDPVIIIPGILGSQQDGSGEWVIDPILHTYDDLIATLDVNHYTPEVDLFTFPYNWRKSNVETAELLKQKIDEVKLICGCEKVDLVAHSMGGLVARQYIQSDAYEQDVDQLIFLGTPHLGAPKAYLMWEGGEAGPTSAGAPVRSVLDSLAEGIMSHEAHENGYDNLFTYIQQEPIASVRELLPVYDYIFKSNLIDYPSGYPENDFLEELNAGIDSLSSSGVEVHNIIGSTAEQGTITGIRVDTEHQYEPMWPHGYPEDYYSLFGDHGLERGSGDGTVPLPSASFVDSNIRTTSYSHNALPLEAQGDVFHLLTDKIAGVLSREFESGVKKLLHIKMLSPADLLVIDPDGKRIGKDVVTTVNEIGEAFYSGANSEVEFITIPNPIDGNYSIVVQGIGSGAYAVEVAYISEDAVVEERYQGGTKPAQITELGLRFDAEYPEAMALVASDTEAPAITITDPVSKDYVRSGQLPIAVSAEDASGLQILETKLGTTTISNSGSVDLFFEKLGTSTITASATDIYGNSTSSARTFRIIATASSTISDFERAYALGWMTKKAYDNLRQKIRAIIVVRKVIKNIVQTVVETGPNGKKTTKKVQKKVEISEQVIDAIAVRAILKELDKHRGRGLEEKAYQLLREDIMWLIK